jgi:hypothetical protein
MSAHISKARPALNVTVPEMSSRLALGSRDSPMNFRVARIRTADAGTFTRNAQRHPTKFVIAPPMNRPNRECYSKAGAPEREGFIALSSSECIRQNCQRGGEQERASHTLGSTGKIQHERIRREATSGGGNCKNHQANKHRLFAATQIRVAARGLQQRSIGQDVRADHPLHIGE